LEKLSPAGSIPVAQMVVQTGHYPTSPLVEYLDQRTFENA
jgi:hypothetical protein